MTCLQAFGLPNPSPKTGANQKTNDERSPPSVRSSAPPSREPRRLDGFARRWTWSRRRQRRFTPTGWSAPTWTRWTRRRGGPRSAGARLGKSEVRGWGALRRSLHPISGFGKEWVSLGWLPVWRGGSGGRDNMADVCTKWSWFGYG